MKVAVVGATGFVGSHLAPHLVDAGHDVIAISRDGRRLPAWTDAVEARAVDVTDGDLDTALAGAEALVHLAAIPRETRGRRFDEVNVRGTQRVVEAAERIGLKRLVHLSVMGVTDDP
ncbi:MAG: NAD-dependent epimerase/dehydratase family protein, partial [Candidatus Limnocylindria bacterium]